MNKRSLIFLLLLLPLSLSAQKARVRSVSFNYYHLPANPLNGAANSYGLIVNNTSTKVKIGNDRINKYLVLKGFEKKNISDADVIIEFSIHGVQTNADIKSKEVEEKVDDEKVKKTKYYYYVSSKTLAKFEMRYKSAVLIKSMNFDGGDFLYEKESGLYDSKTEAQNAFNKNKIALLQNADDSGLESILEHISAYVDDRYAYYYVPTSETIATGKGKKHDYTDLDNALERYRDAVAEYGLNGVSEVFISISNECIDMWKSAISEYDAGNKKARISPKNIDYLYWNIGIAYLYMNDFDNALKTMQAALTVGKNKYSEKAQITLIKNRKTRYELNEKRKKEAVNPSSLVIVNSSTTGQTSVKAPVIALKGINKAYRVKRVVKKYHRGIDDYIDILEYHYKSNQLAYIIKDTKLRIDSIAYDYKPGYINETPYYYGKSGSKNWIKDKKHAKTYNMQNGLITIRASNSEELTYKYNPGGGLEALVRKVRDMGGYEMYKYTLIYQNGQLAKAQNFHFYQGDWSEHKEEALLFSKNGTVVNKLKGAQMYRIEMNGKHIKKIIKYKNFNETKVEFKYIFNYDGNGNIIKQSFLNGYGEVETYEIEYERKAGNEDLFLGTNDWPINIYFHQLTFNDFFEASY
jgi:hypothetical protein